jgi:hypothetical protein
MITAKFGEKEINVPTSWNDVPFKKLIEFLDKDTAISQAACLLDIKESELTKLTSESLAAMFAALSFSSELPDAYIPEIQKLDIGKGTYLQIEMAKAKLQAVDKPYKALNDILLIYTGKDYSNDPSPFPYALAAFFLTNLYYSLSDTND